MDRRVPFKLAERIRERAGHACEYCRLPQSLQEARFNLDHIVPLARGGLTTFENLALACVTCSLKKAARTHARDPLTLKRALLFHPRRDRWSDHFRWLPTCHLAGRTEMGRATISALGINRPAAIRIRTALARLGYLSI
jgi:5-methylcytosine-specific restriction endonuclease McrA